VFKFYQRLKQEVTVDSILSSWTKTIKDLEEHAEAKIVEAAKHSTLVEFYKEAETIASAEVGKAKEVIQKLKALFH
jgi:hypothetical protein